MLQKVKDRMLDPSPKKDLDAHIKLTEEWQRYALTSPDGASIPIPPETDIFSVLGSGFYIGNSLANMPNNDMSYFRIIVNASGSTSRTYIASRSGGQTWIGTMNGNTWQGWEKVVTDKIEWIDLVLQNGVLLYDVAKLQYCKIGNVVFIRGAVRNITAPVTIATLPAGMRPVSQDVATTQNTSVITVPNARFARWTIKQTGAIALEGVTDGTMTAAHWFPINTSFVVQ